MGYIPQALSMSFMASALVFSAMSMYGRIVFAVFNLWASGRSARVWKGDEKREPVWGSLQCVIIHSYFVSTFHPEGTPLIPVTSQVAELLLTKVPVADTPLTQSYKHHVSDMSVASILI